MPVARLATLFATAVAATAAVAADTTITVYPDGAAVVSEARRIPLEAGKQTVRLAGVPERLRPETLWLSGEGVTLLGSAYRQSDGGQAETLRALEGETITVLRDNGSGGDISREATLLTAIPVPVVRIGDRVEWIDSASPWRIAVSGLPEAAGLGSALALTLAAEAAGRTDIDLTYQMDGLSWSAAYVARLDAEAEQLTLRARAALRNDTGTAWDGVDMALIAGQVDRAHSGPQPMMMRAESSAAADSGVAADAAGDYYRYDLPDPVTLARGEQRNVTLFPGQAVPVEREYRIEDGWRRGDGDGQRASAAIRIGFANAFDKPLPGGVVRVYDAGDDAMLLGEARIPDTPTGDDVMLTLGRAFDITAERVTTDTARDDKVRERERRIVVDNARDEEVEVRVVESVPGDWEMLSESDEHERLDANRVAWTLDVPGGGSRELTYRVRYR